MQKKKTGPAPRAAQAMPLVARMRDCLSSIEIEGGAEVYPLLAAHLHRQAKAAPAGSALRRRLLAMRVALLGGLTLRLSIPEPQPAPPPPASVAPPPPPPEPPKGVVSSVTLEDAARMLFASMADDDEPAPAAAAPLKVDFSMFGSDDAEEDSPKSEEPAPAVTAPADHDPFAEEKPATAFKVDFAALDDTPPAATDGFLAETDYDPFAEDTPAPAFKVDFAALDDTPPATTDGFLAETDYDPFAEVTAPAPAADGLIADMEFDPFVALADSPKTKAKSKAKAKSLKVKVHEEDGSGTA